MENMSLSGWTCALGGEAIEVAVGAAGSATAVDE